MRLIDATELQGRMIDMIHEGYGLEDMVDAVIESPTVDAVPVVRCMECTLHDSCYTEDVFKVARLNDALRFCGVGKRKGGDE